MSLRQGDIKIIESKPGIAASEKDVDIHAFLKKKNQEAFERQLADNELANEIKNAIESVAHLFAENAKNCKKIRDDNYELDDLPLGEHDKGLDKRDIQAIADIAFTFGNTYSLFTTDYSSIISTAPAGGLIKLTPFVSQGVTIAWNAVDALSTVPAASFYSTNRELYTRKRNQWRARLQITAVVLLALFSYNPVVEIFLGSATALAAPIYVISTLIDTINVAIDYVRINRMNKFKGWLKESIKELDYNQLLVQETLDELELLEKENQHLWGLTAQVTNGQSMTSMINGLLARKDEIENKTEALLEIEIAEKNLRQEIEWLEEKESDSRDQIKILEKKLTVVLRQKRAKIKAEQQELASIHDKIEIIRRCSQSTLQNLLAANIKQTEIKLSFLRCIEGKSTPSSNANAKNPVTSYEDIVNRCIAYVHEVPALKAERLAEVDKIISSKPDLQKFKLKILNKVNNATADEIKTAESRAKEIQSINEDELKKTRRLLIAKSCSVVGMALLAFFATTSVPFFIGLGIVMAVSIYYVYHYREPLGDALKKLGGLAKKIPALFTSNNKAAEVVSSNKNTLFANNASKRTSLETEKDIEMNPYDANAIARKKAEKEEKSKVDLHQATQNKAKDEQFEGHELKPIVSKKSSV